jgi:hypothetical protein
MLTHLGTRVSFDKISRGVEDQRGQIIAHHVHRETLEKALAYCRPPEWNAIVLIITGPATVTALISWLCTAVLVSSISLA